MVEASTSGYPPKLDALIEGVEDVRDPDKKKIYFMRRLPRDPLYPDSAAPPAETWGLRSYKSPPDAPQPGDDVFDIHSLVFLFLPEKAWPRTARSCSSVTKGN